MAFNNRKIITDLEGKPVPQHYSPENDSYEPVKGTNGASYVQLKGAGVNEDGSLNVKVSSAPSNDSAVTNPTLSATQEALLKGVLKVLQGQGAGALPTTLTGTNVLKDANQNDISRQHDAAPWGWDDEIGASKAAIVHRTLGPIQIFKDYSLGANATYIHNTHIDVRRFQYARIFVKIIGTGNIDILVRVTVNGVDSEEIYTVNLPAGDTNVVSVPIHLCCYGFKLGLKNNVASAQTVNAWVVFQS